MRTALAQGDYVLDGSGHAMWEPQTIVDGFLTDIANPVVKVEQGQVVNLVSLSIDSPTLRRVVPALVPALCQAGQSPLGLVS